MINRNDHIIIVGADKQLQNECYVLGLVVIKWIYNSGVPPIQCSAYKKHLSVPAMIKHHASGGPPLVLLKQDTTGIGTFTFSQHNELTWV